MLRLRSSRVIPPLARQYSSKVPLYINGEIRKGASDPFEVVSPWLNEITHTAENASVEQAVDAAQCAGNEGQEWTSWMPQRRRDVLLKAAEVSGVQV